MHLYPLFCNGNVWTLKIPYSFSFLGCYSLFLFHPLNFKPCKGNEIHFPQFSQRLLTHEKYSNLSTIFGNCLHKVPSYRWRLRSNTQRRHDLGAQNKDILNWIDWVTRVWYSQWWGNKLSLVKKWLLSPECVVLLFFNDRWKTLLSLFHSQSKC